jgi:hypothetical protein
MHAPQHSHIWPGYRYSSLSLQSCETLLQDTFPQASLPQGTDRHCCAAMCITAVVSKHNKTCKNGIRLLRHDQLSYGTCLIMLVFYLIGYPNSLTPFNSETALVWRFTVDGNSRTWNRLRVKCPILGLFGDY